MRSTCQQRARSDQTVEFSSTLRIRPLTEDVEFFPPNPVQPQNGASDASITKNKRKVWLCPEWQLCTRWVKLELLVSSIPPRIRKQNKSGKIAEAADCRTCDQKQMWRLCRAPKQRRHRAGGLTPGWLSTFWVYSTFNYGVNLCESTSLRRRTAISRRFTAAIHEAIAQKAAPSGSG